jgi:pimeloyl-ACP methyl ester carboxylesterase
MPIAPVNGTEIYYEVAGEGEPVVLIPGLGIDHTYYAHAIPQLAKFTKVIALDLRGIGQSAKPKGPYTTELWGEDLNALLEFLGEKQAHVVGSSMGGRVALELVVRHPDKVKSLVLVAVFSELDKALEINFRMRMKIVEQLGIGEVLRDHVTLWTLSRAFIETERGKVALEGLLAGLNKNTPELYLEFLRAILRFGKRLPGQNGEATFTQRLPGISVPTLLMVGDKDLLCPPELMQKMAALMPNSELVVLKECGHITFVEKPEECSRLIVEFIRRVGGGWRKNKGSKS